MWCPVRGCGFDSRALRFEKPLLTKGFRRLLVGALFGFLGRGRVYRYGGLLAVGAPLGFALVALAEAGVPGCVVPGSRIPRLRTVGGRQLTGKHRFRIMQGWCCRTDQATTGCVLPCN
jgi:hypothetical protein